MASSSWCNSSNHDGSQCPQMIISDFDKKMKAVMALLDEEAEASANAPEIYDSTKPQLLHLLEELRGSYRSLNEKCNTIVSQPDGPKFKILCFRLESRDASSECMNMLSYDMIFTEPHDYCSRLEGGVTDNQVVDHAETGDLQSSSHAWENTLFQLKFQVTTLIEENLQQQAELIKRNNEKREIIERLHRQMQCMRGENKILRNSLRHSGTERKSSKSQLPLLGRICRKFRLLVMQRQIA